MSNQIEVTDMLDIEKVSRRQNEELLKIARLQGQWTATKSLLHQAIDLKSLPLAVKQMEVHLESVEKRLVELGAIKPNTQQEPAGATQHKGASRECSKLRTV